MDWTWVNFILLFVFVAMFTVGIVGIIVGNAHFNNDKKSEQNRGLYSFYLYGGTFAFTMGLFGIMVALIRVFGNGARELLAEIKLADMFEKMENSMQKPRSKSMYGL
jgi:hypothetical protein